MKLPAACRLPRVWMTHVVPLDLMKTYPDLKAVVSFGSNGPIGAGRAVKEKRAKNKVAVYGMMILHRRHH